MITQSQKLVASCEQFDQAEIANTRKLRLHLGAQPGEIITVESSVQQQSSSTAASYLRI